LEFTPTAVAIGSARRGRGQCGLVLLLLLRQHVHGSRGIEQKEEDSTVRCHPPLQTIQFGYWHHKFQVVVYVDYPIKPTFSLVLAFIQLHMHAYADRFLIIECSVSAVWLKQGLYPWQLHGGNQELPIAYDWSRVYTPNKFS
jgi:hypothetical protein